VGLKPGGLVLEMQTIRVIVVEDYEPFRRFVCSTLRQRPELQVICDVSDGLEAVQKAEELRPDLVVLDLGLPTLNGMEVARRIRKLSPASKILFLSQEDSADIVQEALCSGAQGYVVKADAGSELLPAVEAVRQGQRFISSRLSGLTLTDNEEEAEGRNYVLREETPPSIAPTEGEITRTHQVEFYSDDAAFVVGFSRFIKAGLEAGKAVIVVATELHRKGLFQRLQEDGVDIIAAIAQGRYVSVDVADTLSTFMGNDLPDPVRFFRVAGNLIAPAARAIAGERSRVAICGECGSILWAQGKADAAIQVEQLCRQLAKRYEMDILCGFSLSSFYSDEVKELFQKIGRE
jgi:DNA-binding NarL/FixJ family response regulator